MAHGSGNPRAAATISQLLAQLRSLAAARGLDGLEIKAAFLDHCAPSLPQVLDSVTGAAGCVVVPLLLTAAYHSKTDIPAQIASAGASRLDIRCADPLGPHPLLLDALERRLTEAGVGVSVADREQTSVVLAAAGSSDQAANAANAALAARWRAVGGWRRVVPAYASADGPSPAEAVRALLAPGGLRVPPSPPRVVVATYLLAPGYFADKIRACALAAGAAAVSGVLGASPEVADVILDRYEAAVRGRNGAAPTRVRAEPSVPLVAGAQLSERVRGDFSVNNLLHWGKPNKGAFPDARRACRAANPADAVGSCAQTMTA